MDHLLGSLNEICDPSSPQYFHLVTRIDSAVWLPASLERIYIVLVHQSVGVQVVNRMRKLFETAPVVSGKQQCRQCGARLKANAPPPVPPSESADAGGGIHTIILGESSGSGGCLAFGRNAEYWTDWHRSKRSRRDG